MVLPRRLRPGEEATLYEHLGELRGRLIVCLVAVTLGFIVAFVFHDHLVRSLRDDGCEVGVHGLRHDGKDLGSRRLLRRRLPRRLQRPKRRNRRPR